MRITDDFSTMILGPYGYGTPAINTCWWLPSWPGRLWPSKMSFPQKRKVNNELEIPWAMRDGFNGNAEVKVVVLDETRERLAFTKSFIRRSMRTTEELSTMRRILVLAYGSHCKRPQNATNQRTKRKAWPEEIGLVWTARRAKSGDTIAHGTEKLQRNVNCHAVPCSHLWQVLGVQWWMNEWLCPTCRWRTKRRRRNHLFLLYIISEARKMASANLP